LETIWLGCDGIGTGREKEKLSVPSQVIEQMPKLQFHDANADEGAEQRY